MSAKVFASFSCEHFLCSMCLVVLVHILRGIFFLFLALAMALTLIYFHSLYALSSTFPFIFCVFSCSSVLVSMPLSIWLPRVCYSQFPCLWFFYRKTIISLRLSRSLARRTFKCSLHDLQRLFANFFLILSSAE